jgi:uncharacterized protein
MKKYILIPVFILLAFFRVNAEEVSIVVNGCKIIGTLEVPKADHPIDVALIISGSGPTDRNGNVQMIPAMNNNSLKMVSELLYKNDVASLRYDKRGIGASDKVNEAELTFDMYVNDAVEWAKLLKKDKRFSGVIIIGHSEGSLIGMIAAERIDIKKYVSLCGSGELISKTIIKQITDSKAPQEIINNCTVIMDSLKAGNLVKNVDPKLFNLFRPSIQPYMISWMKYDPCKEISKLTAPILIIGGTTDLQIDVKNAEALSKSNPKSKLKIIENMNHILKNVPTIERKANIQSYYVPDLALSEALSKTLIEFIK